MIDPDPDDAARDSLARETAGALEHWARARRAEVDRAVRETDREDRARAVATFERLARADAPPARPARTPESDAPPAPGPRRILPWLAAAAALIAAVGIGTLARGRDATPASAPSTWLGEDAVETVPPHPSGTVDSYDPFKWDAIASGPTWYRLTVWNAGEPEAVLRTDPIAEASYSPTAEELARLGPRITWEVVAVDEDGTSIGRVAGTDASLRSRSR